MAFDYDYFISHQVSSGDKAFINLVLQADFNKFHEIHTFTSKSKLVHPK